MKATRLLLALVAAGAAGSLFAGPGPQYWAARREARAEVAAAKPAPAADAPCATMLVKEGKRTVTVKCDAATRATAKCQAACGS